MSRKTRRRIRRRKRGKSKSRKRRGLLDKHFSGPITNRWTKETTYALIVLDSVFVIWYLQDTLLYWQDIVSKLRNVIYIIKSLFGV